MVSLSPTEIYDRDNEAALLAALLGADARRVMAVSDRTGMGKTEVLRKLGLLCRTVHNVPVAMLQFNEYVSRPDLFSIVTDLQAELADAGAVFPTFERLTSARNRRDMSTFSLSGGMSAVDEARLAGGIVQADNANISGGQVAGTIVNGDLVISGEPRWNPDIDEQAKQVIIDSFVNDLLEFAREQRVVLLFDTVENAADALQRWLFVRLVRRRVLASSDHRLVVVMAGQGLRQTLESQFTEQDLQRVVHVNPGDSVRAWGPDDVAGFLKSKGVRDLRDDQIEAVHAYIASGGSLAIAILMATDLQMKEAS